MATMVKSMALEGIEGFPVEIEAATIKGQQQMISVIGLGDQAVKEAGERMQAAMSCCGYDLPKDKTLISLAPGNRRKRGSHYDLGMTLALLAETDQITVVGARRCSREDKGKCIARVERCGEENPIAIIISGGAKGIDGYAHTAAIKNGLRTIAFVGTGPDLSYPREHRELFDKISENGMILSEYPPGTSAKPYHFPRRNRLIAAWSDEMYVIGAGRNSGTRSTVRYFHEYN